MKRDLENIIKEIKRLGLTAYEISKRIPVSTAGIQKIINGESTNPRPTTIMALNSYLDQLEQHPEVLRILEEESGSYSPNKNGEYKTKAGNKITELSNGKYKMTVSLVTRKAQATYVSEFTDAEFIEDLTEVDFIVDHVPKGRYLAFEIQNDSMNDGTIESIPDGSIVLGREVSKDHWQNKLHTKDYPYWIIVHKDTILCKEISFHNTEKCHIVCHSLNSSPEFQDFTIPLNDCLQLFNIIKKQI